MADGQYLRTRSFSINSNKQKFQGSAPLKFNVDELFALHSSWKPAVQTLELRSAIHCRSTFDVAKTADFSAGGKIPTIEQFQLIIKLLKIINSSNRFLYTNLDIFLLHLGSTYQ